jgi:hypothetical protein
MDATTERRLDLGYLRSQIIGVDAKIRTPFGERLMLYADYTASGRSLHFVEDYLVHLQQLYANSHTEDDTSGRVTTELLHQAEDRIKPGWCRVGFHFVFDEAEVEYLLSCVEFVAEHGHSFLSRYHFDAKSGGWQHREWQQQAAAYSLIDALQTEVSRPRALSAGKRQEAYQAYLDEAEELAHQARHGA